VNRAGPDGPVLTLWEEEMFRWNVRLGPIQFMSPIPRWAVLLFLLTFLFCCCCGIPAFSQV
jgi:hypothetical protein